MADRVASDRVEGLLATAGQGLARGAWAEAREHYQQALRLEESAEALEGLAVAAWWLDEGTAAATAGELHDPIAIGSCCCNMIIACERSRDFERAGQWCEQLVAFAGRTGQRPLLALCRAHHGTVLAARGQWDEASDELAWAAGELGRLRPPLAGFARARLALLRHRQGRDREAQELLDAAGDFVLVWLVRAELALDTGDFAAALGHAERYVRSLGPQRTIEAAAAYELLVRVGIGLGELDRARGAHRALQEIAIAVGNDCLHAAERRAAGEIAMAEGDAARAARLFEDAVGLNRRATAAFDLAQARVALAAALAASDRRAAAIDEAGKAAAALVQLGAGGAARDAASLLARLGGPEPTAANRWRLTGRELEVLGLVADGLSNAMIAERLVISEHTVHRHIANIFAKLRVSTRAAAVAVAAEHELLG